MRWKTSRPRLATLALGCMLALTAGACGGGSQGTAQESRSPRRVPNPFTITARFDPASLGLTHPPGLAVGPDGNLYVTDRSQSAAAISPEGKVLHRWGKAGDGPGEFSFISFDSFDPSDVSASIAAGPDGKVYISDSGNKRIQVFSPTGAFIRQFGSFGNGEGQFQAPFDLVADRSGNIYVADDADESVSKYSSAGRYVWRVGGSSAKDPDLLGHEHLASIDAHGRIVMANDANGKIIYLDANGRKVDVFAPPELRAADSACDVTVDASGNTFVGTQCSKQGTTLVFDRTHELIGGWYSDNPLGSPPRFGPNGEAFALGLDGTIFKLTVALPAR
jgi:streptogramin lyase